MLDAKPLSFRDASQIFQPRSGDRLQPTAQAVGGTRESPSGAKKKGSSMEPDPNVRKSQSLRTRRQLHDSLLNRPHH